jgi:uncharacterized membrane protein
MELFLPSILLSVVALLFISFALPNISKQILLIGSAILLVFAIYNHSTTFTYEYNVMEWAMNAKAIAPTLMITLIVVLTGAYIIFLQGFSVKALNMPSSSIPPPSTATNPLTAGIGNGLANAGMVGVNNSYRVNNAAANALSAGV